jgi:hypothetical protein
MATQLNPRYGGFASPQVVSGLKGSVRLLFFRKSTAPDTPGSPQVRNNRRQLSSILTSVVYGLHASVLTTRTSLSLAPLVRNTPVKRRFIANFDTVHGGNYFVHGALTELSIPGAYKTRLYSQKIGMLVKETWSDANGVYSFPHLKYFLEGYFVVAFDGTAPYARAVIADRVTPDPMVF